MVLLYHTKHQKNSPMATCKSLNFFEDTELQIGVGMDGWLTCHVISFSTVFQSYQDDGQLMMNDHVQWNPV